MRALIPGVYCTPLNPWDYFQRLHVESTPMFIAYPKTVSEKGTVPCCPRRNHLRKAFASAMSELAFRQTSLVARLRKEGVN